MDQSHIVKEECGRVRSTSDCSRLTGMDLRFEAFSDSLLVVFDGERVQAYCGSFSECTFDKRNLFLIPVFQENEEHSTGWVKTIEDGTQVFTFTITEEDYENAELL